MINDDSYLHYVDDNHMHYIQHCFRKMWLSLKSRTTFFGNSVEYNVPAVATLMSDNSITLEYLGSYSLRYTLTASKDFDFVGMRTTYFSYWCHRVAVTVNLRIVLVIYRLLQGSDIPSKF